MKTSPRKLQEAAAKGRSRALIYLCNSITGRKQALLFTNTL